MKLVHSTIRFFRTPKFRAFVTIYWLPVSGFFIFSSIALWFGFTFLADAIYFNDPKNKDDELKGWMTPRYIQLSYDLPREVIIDALDLPEDLDSMRRMKDIAKNKNMTLPGLTEHIRKVAIEYRASQPNEELK